MLRDIIFEIIVFLSNIVQCVTGFAGTVLAMPFSVITVGYNVAKPILNVLGIAASVGVIADAYKSINKKEFVKIVSVMLLGILAGMYLIRFFTGSGELFYKLLGSVVIIFAIVNGYKFIRNKESKKINGVVSFLMLAAAGVVHGMFVCGGPLLVTYASVKLKETNEFRATLSATWIVLNTVILFGDIKTGYFNVRVIILLFVSIVVLAAAVVIGNIISKRLSKRLFLVLTYILMLISGVSLLVK